MASVSPALIVADAPGLLVLGVTATSESVEGCVVGSVVGWTVGVGVGTEFSVTSLALAS